MYVVFNIPSEPWTLSLKVNLSAITLLILTLNNISLELVGPQILVSCAWWDHNMHQLCTCTVDKEHVKHKTEWVTSKQLNAKFQLVFQIFASSTRVSLNDINTCFRSILATELFLEAWELSTYTLWGCNSDKHYSTARQECKMPYLLR